MLRPVGTSLGGTVRRSELWHLRDHSRSRRTGYCQGPAESWADARHAADTTPSTGRGSVAGPAANPESVDSPEARSAVSTHREPGESRTSLHRGAEYGGSRSNPRQGGGRRRGTPTSGLPVLRCQQSGYVPQASGPASRGRWVWRSRCIGDDWKRSFPATAGSVPPRDLGHPGSAWSGASGGAIKNQRLA